MGNNKEVIMAYAEFSTSRLMLKNSPKLVIRRKADGGEVVNIPLNNYLLAFGVSSIEIWTNRNSWTGRANGRCYFFLMLTTCG